MLLQLPLNKILVPVSDRIPGIILQKVKCTKLTIEDDDNGSSVVRMKLLVRLYNAQQEEISGSAGFVAYERTLVADNNTAVNPETGAIRFILNAGVATDFDSKEEHKLDATEFGGSSWLAFLEQRPEALALQGDFFSMLRDTQDVRIRTLIEQHIAQADAMNRFA